MTELAFPDEIFDISALVERQNVLIYGPPGAGKSVLAGGAGLIIAVEPSGPVSAKRMGSKAKIWPAPTWEKFEAAVEWLEQTYADGHDPFQWIAIDSADAMQQAMMRWILEEEKLKKPDRDVDRPEIQDHFKWQQMFKRFILRLNDLPCNVLYLAKEFRYEVKTGEEVRIPSFDGKAKEGFGIASWVCASVDAVGYMEVKTVSVRPKGWKEGEPLKKAQRRRITFGPQSDRYTKDRSGNLVPHVQDVTLDELHRRMLIPPKEVRPIPLAGVAEREDGSRQVPSERVKELPSAGSSEDNVQDAEVLDESLDDDEESE